MPIKKTILAQAVAPVESPLALSELATVLVKHYGLHEGRYDVIVEFQIGVGPVGPSLDKAIPGAMIGVSKIGLIPTQKEGGAAVDAAVVNPEKRRVRSKAA